MHNRVAIAVVIICVVAVAVLAGRTRSTHGGHYSPAVRDSQSTPHKPASRSTHDRAESRSIAHRPFETPTAGPWRIVNEALAPIEGAMVFLAETRPIGRFQAAPKEFVTSNSDGLVVRPVDVPIDRSIMVWHADYRPLIVSPDNDALSEVGTPSLVLRRGSTLAVKGALANGQPASGAVVAVSRHFVDPNEVNLDATDWPPTSDETRSIRTVKLDAAGRGRMTALAPGTYHLAASMEYATEVGRIPGSILEVPDGELSIDLQFAELWGGAVRCDADRVLGVNYSIVAGEQCENLGGGPADLAPSRYADRLKKAMAADFAIVLAPDSESLKDGPPSVDLKFVTVRHQPETFRLQLRPLRELVAAERFVPSKLRAEATATVCLRCATETIGLLGEPKAVTLLGGPSGSPTAFDVELNVAVEVPAGSYSIFPTNGIALGGFVDPKSIVLKASERKEIQVSLAKDTVGAQLSAIDAHSGHRIPAVFEINDESGAPVGRGVNVDAFNVHIRPGRYAVEVAAQGFLKARLEIVLSIDDGYRKLPVLLTRDVP